MSTFNDKIFFVPLDGATNDRVSFPLTVHMMKFIMCWPLKEGAHKFVNLLYFALFWYITLQMFFIVFGEYYYIITNWGDIDKVTDCICTCVTGQHSFLRYLLMYIKRDKFKKILENFGKFIYISPKNYPELSEECVNEMKLVGMISVTFIFAASSYAIIPFISQESEAAPRFPFKVEYPFNVWGSPLYEIVYTMSAIVGYDAGVAMFACDSTFAFLVVYTCGQFKILNENFKNLNDFDANGARLSSEEKTIRLRNMIEHHNAIIGFIDDLEELFSPMVWINFMHSSLVICVIAFQLVLINSPVIDKVKYLFYFISVLSQLFLICYEGDKLRESSVSIADAAFTCDWGQTDGSISFTKSLQMVIRRSQVPKVITAMKFSDLSLQSYTGILSSSMSYFTLLKALIEDMDI